MSPITTYKLERLKQSLSSTATVLAPNSSGYDESIKRWSSAAEKRAGLVVFPTSAEDISKAILFARKNSMEIAVGSAFHGMFSSTSGGLSLNLSKLRSVSVDPSTQTITAQGGCLWSDVESAAAEHDLAAVGVTVSSVGIAGSTLGGGYGHLSAAHGLAIDNLLSVELVLADGRIVMASNEENEDLFWAVRGAGSLFGIATSFTFRAHKQENLVYGGTLTFAQSQLAEVIDFANQTMEVSNGEASMMVGFSGSNVVAVVFYNGGEEAAKSFYEPLLALKPIENGTSMVPYSQVNSWYDSTVLGRSRRTLKGSALLTPVSSSFVAKLHETYTSLLTDVPDAANTLIMFDFISFNKIMSVPQTATAFAHRGAFVNVLFAPSWNSAALDSTIKSWTLNMAAKTDAELARQKAAGTDEVTQTAAGEYGNFDGLGSSGAKKVFGINYERLLSLKMKYDPMNLFSKGKTLVSVTSALPELAATALSGSVSTVSVEA